MRILRTFLALCHLLNSPRQLLHRQPQQTANLKIVLRDSPMDLANTIVIVAITGKDELFIVAEAKVKEEEGEEDHRKHSRTELRHNSCSTTGRFAPL